MQKKFRQTVIVDPAMLAETKFDLETHVRELIARQMVDDMIKDKVIAIRKHKDPRHIGVVFTGEITVVVEGEE